MYAPDLPGYGASDPLGPGVEPTPERFAVVMAAFLDAITTADAGPAVVVGHSLGGSIALELALRHPEEVGHLVLEDSAGLGHYATPALRALTFPGARRPRGAHGTHEHRCHPPILPVAYRGV